jgi:hypothetical protein
MKSKSPSELVNKYLQPHFTNSDLVDAIYEAYNEGRKDAYMGVIAHTSDLLSLYVDKNESVSGVRDMAFEQIEKDKQEAYKNRVDEQKRIDEEDNL